MNTLNRATALFVITLALALSFSGNVFAIEPSPVPYKVFDYTFEPATGALFSADGVKLPFTFEFVEVKGKDARGNETVQRLSPLQYATADTAAKVLKFVQGIAPEAKAEAISDYPWGPYTFTAAQRSVLVYGERLNAGLIANSIIVNGESKAAQMVLADIDRARKEWNRLRFAALIFGGSPRIRGVASVYVSRLELR